MTAHSSESGVVQVHGGMIAHSSESGVSLPVRYTL
jgi:hypothetical protein